MADDLVPAWAAPVFRRRLAQPDTTTCGPTSLVVAHIVLDEEYADRASEPEIFRKEVLALHQRVTSRRDTRGRLQLPWPARFGTPPWAAARQMTAITEASYDQKFARTRRERAFDRIIAATSSGRPAPVFVGSKWLPRHVVLALGVVDGSLRFYEPAHGRLVDVSRADFAKAKLGLAGWDRPWFIVVPD